MRAVDRHYRIERTFGPNHDPYLSEHLMSCEHLNRLEPIEPTTTAGCEECLKIGGRWVHLRMCMACGHVGCCDSSPNRHATAHFHASDHPVVQSLEPGEHWAFCYVDNAMIDNVGASVDRFHD